MKVLLEEYNLNILLLIYQYVPIFLYYTCHLGRALVLCKYDQYLALVYIKILLHPKKV